MISWDWATATPCGHECDRGTQEEYASTQGALAPSPTRPSASTTADICSRAGPVGTPTLRAELVPHVALRAEPKRSRCTARTTPRMSRSMPWARSSSGRTASTATTRSGRSTFVVSTKRAEHHRHRRSDVRPGSADAAPLDVEHRGVRRCRGDQPDPVRSDDGAHRRAREGRRVPRRRRHRDPVAKPKDHPALATGRGPQDEDQHQARLHVRDGVECHAHVGRHRSEPARRQRSDEPDGARLAKRRSRADHAVPRGRGFVNAKNVRLTMVLVPRSASTAASLIKVIRVRTSPYVRQFDVVTGDRDLPGAHHDALGVRRQA